MRIRDTMIAGDRTPQSQEYLDGFPGLPPFAIVINPVRLSLGIPALHRRMIGGPRSTSPAPACPFSCSRTKKSSSRKEIYGSRILSLTRSKSVSGARAGRQGECSASQSAKFRSAFSQESATWAIWDSVNVGPRGSVTKRFLIFSKTGKAKSEEVNEVNEVNDVKAEPAGVAAPGEAGGDGAGAGDIFEKNLPSVAEIIEGGIMDACHDAAFAKIGSEGFAICA